MDFTNLDLIGLSLLKESTAFKKILVKSKLGQVQANPFHQLMATRYRGLQSTFISDNLFFKSSEYALSRQHTLLNLKAPLVMTGLTQDPRGFLKLLNHNCGPDGPKEAPILGIKALPKGILTGGRTVKNLNCN